MASFASIKSAVFDRQEKKQQYQAHILGLNAYDRHKKFLDDYGSGVLNQMDDEQSSPIKERVLQSSVYQKDGEQSPSLKKEGGYSRPYICMCQFNFYGKGNSASLKLPIKTDQDTLREGYRFIRSEEDDLDPSWEQRLVKRYYSKLFKEYCIADMSHYKSGKIGLRWRVEKEVISGKGQFTCGNKHCDERAGLVSYEVNFCYTEAGEQKQALVKLVTCERCAEKLNHKRQKEREKLLKSEKKEYKRKRDQGRSDEDTDGESEASKERRTKGKKTSVSTSDRKDDDNENFDEFLEGMFP